MRCWSLAAVSLFCLAPASRGSCQNLLTNSSFEDVGADGVVTGWTSSGAATIISDPRTAHTGRNAVRVRFDDRFQQALPIDGGEMFRIRGYVRREHTDGTDVPKIKVYFLDLQGQRVDVKAAEITNVQADGYTAFEAIMRAPETAVTLNLALCGMYQGREWFYYDDLAVERISSRNWPLWEKTPDLHGVTVVPADIADVWTDALLRIPPRSIAPIDGLVDTSVETHGKDIRLLLTRPYGLNYLLVHTMKPLQTPREGAFLVRDKDEVLLRIRPEDSLVVSCPFAKKEIAEFVIDLPENTSADISEIQAFRLNRDKWSPPGEPRAMRVGSEALPPEMQRHLERAYPREEDRISRLASPVSRGDGGRAPLKAGRVLNIVALPGREAYAVSALELGLPVASATPDALLEIRLKQPAELDCDLTAGTRLAQEPQDRRYSDMLRVVTRVGGGERSLTLRFDIPDTLFAAGEPLWTVLRPSADLVLDLSSARVTAYTIPMAQACPEYVPRLERVMRRMYSYATEGHVYDGSDYKPMLLNRYVQRVLELDPDNEPARLILNRIARRKAPVELTRAGPAGAPDWAVWQRLALKNMHDLITWWLDNRQQADGQLGGHINDDGEFSCNWPSDYLITGDRRVLEGLRKLADVAWQMSGGKGYTVGSRDVEHAAEDQSCTQPQLVICDYGSPKTLERMMVMSQHLDFWTDINSVGRRQFKSFMFTTDQIWDEPPNDVDHAYCPLAMVGAGHLIWYADIPSLRKLFLEEAESWAAACMSTDKGKPLGAIPAEIRFSDSEILPYYPYDRTNPILKGRDDLYMGGAGHYIVQYLLQGAYLLTGDAKFIEPLHVNDPPPEQVVRRAEETLRSFQVADLSDGSWTPDQSETTLYEAWKTTGDKRWLVEEFKECVRQQERTRWLLTEAEPYTDRISYPGRTLLAMTYLGGFTSGKSHVPGHAVSWEGGGTEFSALVLDARRDHLKVLVCSFAPRAREMRLRVWALAHGRYRLVAGLDSDADDQPDSNVSEETLELARYSAVCFTAPSCQSLILDLSLIEELDPITTRPDLAIGPEDVCPDGDKLGVTVHNVGAAPTPPAILQVQDAWGRIVCEAGIPPIEAPFDLKPRRAQVEVFLSQPPKNRWRVVLDPNNRVREIAEVNNTAEVGS